jgi:hypothetical protein
LEESTSIESNCTKELPGPGQLTSAERKRVLLNNIYGVDIDPQAVEVTKLSLRLKVLEGESVQSIQRELATFRKRALPDLGSNIKCGNSLIRHDYATDLRALLQTPADLARVNPFDWDTEFPTILGGGTGASMWSSREPHTPGQEKNDLALGAPLARSFVGKVAKTVRRWATGLCDHAHSLQLSIALLLWA